MNAKALMWTFFSTLALTALTFYLTLAVIPKWGISKGSILLASLTFSALICYLIANHQHNRWKKYLQAVAAMRAQNREPLINRHKFCIALLELYKPEEIEKTSVALRQVVESEKPDKLNELLLACNMNRMPAPSELASLAVTLRELIEDRERAEKRYGFRAFFLFGLIPMQVESLRPTIEGWQDVMRAAEKEEILRLKTLEILFCTAFPLAKAHQKVLHDLVTQYEKSDTSKAEGQEEKDKQEIRVRMEMCFDALKSLKDILEAERPSKKLTEKFEKDFRKLGDALKATSTRFMGESRAREERRRNRAKAAQSGKSTTVADLRVKT